VPEFSVRFREVAPGRGQVDYVAYLQAIAELRREAPLMLEHLPNAELYKEGADYIRATAIKAAVELV
jgi:sugar phosphate isomerase/epimerase